MTATTKPLPPGPWTVKTSPPDGIPETFATLTRQQVEQLVLAAPFTGQMSRAVYPTHDADMADRAGRVLDRALQLARRHGLLVYDRERREWRRP